MSPRRLLNLLSAVPLAAALSACVNLKPAVDPTRFYVLSVEPAKAPLAGSATLSLPVFVSPIETPAYLDNPRLVLRRQSNELEYLEFHQWAEPLRDGLTRCLREHLAAWLGANRVPPLGRRQPAGDSLEVQSSVSQFEAKPSGEVVLMVRWRIIRTKTGAVLCALQTEIVRRGGSVVIDPGSIAVALSDAVASWSREVAEAMTKL